MRPAILPSSPPTASSVADVRPTTSAKDLSPVRRWLASGWRIDRLSYAALLAATDTRVNYWGYVIGTREHPCLQLNPMPTLPARWIAWRPSAGWPHLPLSLT